MNRYKGTNQIAFLSQPELSKPNQKYHMAMESKAAPAIPGQRRTWITKAATGKAASDRTPAAPRAAWLAMRTPKRESGAIAHTKYTRRAVREMIQLLVIGRYNIAAQLSTL